MDPELSSAVDEVPLALVVLGAQHHAVMHLQVGRLRWQRSAFQVLRGGHDVTDASAEPRSDDARVLQLSEPDGDIYVLREQIEIEIRDEEVDADPRMLFQESRNKIKKRLLAENHRNGDPQQTFRCPLALNQDPLRFLQESERLLALVQVLAPLSCHGNPRCGAP